MTIYVIVMHIYSIYIYNSGCKVTTCIEECEIERFVFLYIWIKYIISQNPCSHQMTNNLMERYKQDFNDMFVSPNHGHFVFCEHVCEEVKLW